MGIGGMNLYMGSAGAQATLRDSKFIASLGSQLRDAIHTSPTQPASVSFRHL